MTAESSPATPPPPKVHKEAPKNLVIPPKKPKLSKVERRALQESQRAEKAAGGGANGGPLASVPPPAAAAANKDVTPAAVMTDKSTVVDDIKAISSLAHLPRYRDPTSPEFSGVVLGGPEYSALHPAVLTLGMAYAQGHIRGGNPRARSMLECFAVVFKEYTPPPTGDVRQHLDHFVLKPSFTYWTTMCRPHSVSMGNAFTFLKNAVTSLPRENMTLAEMVETLVETIHDYIREHITYADQAIANFASDKIVNGDVLLTYANPSVLPVLIETALEQGKDFRVIVVDSRPLLEGKLLLKKLQALNVECTYILLHALSYVMPQVTKVVLGASALLSEGSILSRAGTACIALLAHQSGIPVLVCAETYKMSHRTQLDSITNNELGNPNDILASGQDKNLRVMNLLYDLTPSHMVSAIVTEVGMLPPTSVAVLLREMKLSESGY